MKTRRHIHGGETHARKEKGHPSEGSPKQNSRPDSIALRGWWCMVKPYERAPAVIQAWGELENPPHIEGYTTKRKRLDGYRCGNCGGEVGHPDAIVGFEIDAGNGFVGASEYRICRKCFQSGKPLYGALADAQLQAKQFALLTNGTAAGGVQ